MDNEFEKATYSIAETSRILNVNDSCIRVWIKSFPNIFNINFDGKRKELTKSDIDKLKYIKDLREKYKFSLSQIEEHSKKHFREFDINEENHEKEDFARELFTFFSVELFTQLKDLDKANRNNLKELYIKLYDSLLDKIEETQNEIKNMIVEQNKINEERYKKLENLLIDLNSNSSKKSLFSKLK